MTKKKHQPIEQPLPQYNTIAVLLIIIAIGIISYWNSMNAPFAFDDFSNIVNNEEIKKPSIYYDLNRPRYIALITLALNYQYSELNTFSYHLFNIIIHLLNGIMVYFLIQLIMKILHDQGCLTYRREIPLLAALIFLVHPIQTQAVTYIVQRMT